MASDSEALLESRDQYTFYVPPEARWETVRHLKEDVGTGSTPRWAS